MANSVRPRATRARSSAPKASAGQCGGASFSINDSMAYRLRTGIDVRQRAGSGLSPPVAGFTKFVTAPTPRASPMLRAIG